MTAREPAGLQGVASAMSSGLDPCSRPAVEGLWVHILLVGTRQIPSAAAAPGPRSCLQAIHLTLAGPPESLGCAATVSCVMSSVKMQL